MPTIELPLFVPDSRGNRLESWVIRRYDEGCVAYLKCAAAVAKQVRWAFHGDGTMNQALTRDERRHWTHAVAFTQCPTERLEKLLLVLQRVLTLEVTPVIDLGIALDFYKDPVTDADGKVTWRDTPAGTLVNRLKHRDDMTALDPLAGALAQVVREHEIVGRGHIVVSVPGHTSAWSYGEVLAEKVAALSGREFVRMKSRSASRPQAKARDPDLDLTHEFIPPPAVNGRVSIIVDDVYMTGGSSRAAADTLRRAGATGVIVLAGARTRRN
jgi:hypothetical protein